MKKLLYILTGLTALSSCGTTDSGQLTGVSGRPQWYQADPYGTLYIPPGSFVMGQNDVDVPTSYTTKSKTVSVSPFYMDDSEITNNEYRQFVFWVRDSIAHRILGEEVSEEHLVFVNE